MAEGYQEKAMDSVAYTLNGNLAYSTNAEMLNAVSNYIGSGNGYQVVRCFSVRCSEAPLNGSQAFFIFIGHNVWGTGLGWNSSGLFRLAFNNSAGSIVKILTA